MSSLSSASLKSMNQEPMSSEPMSPEETSSKIAQRVMTTEAGPIGWAPVQPGEAKWYAVFTLPQNEKSAARQLAIREVETFLPTYETVKVWRNRQRVRTVLPLFPTYLFVRIDCRQRRRVLESPGVIQIVGSSRAHAPVADAEIEWLRAGMREKTLEPFNDLVVGKKARIKTGSMEGVEGVLVRKGNGLKFVLSLKLINQHAAIEVCADDLEPIPD
jgi:transcription antitermination factor NusG